MPQNQENEKQSLVMSEIMTPDMVNFHGNVHGGDLLKLLDRVAYVCASRYSGKPTVTLSVDQVVFKEPIHVGELVTFYASVNYVGNSSMEIGIRVVAENFLTNQSRHTNTCYFTMVAIDEKGKPSKISPLKINNEVQQQRFDQALLRKKVRLSLQKKS
jgi:acyl-CoA hydrolase